MGEMKMVIESDRHELVIEKHGRDSMGGFQGQGGGGVG